MIMNYYESIEGVGVGVTLLRIVEIVEMIVKMLRLLIVNNADC